MDTETPCQAGTSTAVTGITVLYKNRHDHFSRRNILSLEAMT